MSHVLIFYALLLAVVVVAWWRGTGEERFAAAICVLGTALTVLAGGALADRFRYFDLASFAVDVGVFVAFLVLALRSDRFWPIWVAGLQMTATTVHMLKIINPDLMRFVFGVALAFWSYPILLLIGIGAWRTAMVEAWRRERRLPEAA